jgi:hypothetical protein
MSAKKALLTPAHRAELKALRPYKKEIMSHEVDRNRRLEIRALREKLLKSATSHPHILSDKDIPDVPDFQPPEQKDISREAAVMQALEHLRMGKARLEYIEQLETLLHDTHKAIAVDNTKRLTNGTSGSALVVATVLLASCTPFNEKAAKKMATAPAAAVQAFSTAAPPSYPVQNMGGKLTVQVRAPR